MFDYQSRLNTPINSSLACVFLSSVQVKTTFVTHSTLKAPWGIDIPEIENCYMFHYVVHGSAVIKEVDKHTVLQQGDIALLSVASDHQVSSDCNVPTTPLVQLPMKSITERFEVLNIEGSGEKTEMICGVVVLSPGMNQSFFRFLPPCFVLSKAIIDETPAISTTMSLLLKEVQQTGSASEVLIAKYAEVILISAVRTFIQENDKLSANLLHNLQDKRIAKVIDEMKASPDIQWTLKALAKISGMSRTSFCQQFKRVLGMTPMEYLTEWRIGLAITRLKGGQESILSIALSLGYQSEAAFYRVFKKYVGQSPGQFKREACAHLTQGVDS